MTRLVGRSLGSLAVTTALAVLGCGHGGDDDSASPADDDDDTTVTSGCEDSDGDTFPAGNDCPPGSLLDCDDSDASIHLGAEDIPGNGVDENCDFTDGPTFPLADADAHFTGEDLYWSAGADVSGVGDVDADGLDDVLVCAPKVDPYELGYTEGHCYLFHGPLAGAYSTTEAHAVLVAEEPGDGAGESAAGAGDIDADGFADVLVGAWASWVDNRDGGRAYLLRGPLEGTVDLADADTVFQADEEYLRAGECVASAGDVDADGRADVLIGAPVVHNGGTEFGRVYLFRGPVLGAVPLSTADAVLTGEQVGDRAGSHTAGAGDVNGDGFDDVLVGALLHQALGYGTGRSYLVHGPVEGDRSLANADATFLGEAEDDRAGIVAGAGDVNGDGFDDVLIGAYMNEEAGDSAGKAYLVRGPIQGDIDLASADTTFLPEAENEWAGFSVSAAGDVNGDGSADLLIGVPGYFYVNEQRHGKAYLYLGPIEGGALSPTEAEWVFVGEGLADWAASSIDAAGDVDGDGLDDLLFGAPQNADGGAYAGKAYLWLGR